MKIHIFLPVALCLLLASCIKDELANTECDIISAWVEGDEYRSMFYQPETDMRFDRLSSTETHIIFTVRSTLSLPHMPVYFDITPGATIEPASGSVQDFSQPVTYTVTSEDGQWQRKYLVEFREPDLPKLHYDFENVEEKTEQLKFLFFNIDATFYQWYETTSQNGQETRQDIWATGNPGFGMGNSGAQIMDYPTLTDADGFDGKCVKMVTRDAGPFGRPLKKPIAAGNLYLGKFDVGEVTTNPLASTKMGIRAPFDEEPIKVTGYYKYRPGAEYINEEGAVQPGVVDQGHIYSVIYRNQDENGNAVMLDGSNVLSSKYIVKKAEMRQLPPTDTWTPFEMFFEGEPLDQQILDNRGYNFTLVFTSSKDGARFLGSIGSTLYVDKVAITLKNEE